MIPDFLNDYRNELEKFKLDCITITAVPIEDGEALKITQSKFLGHPYLPSGFAYPKDKNGTPLILMAQINFEEVPVLENYPTSGILQFYIAATDWYDMTDYKIIYHENISKEQQTDFSFLTEDLYAESPVASEHKLTFEKRIEYGGSEDYRFNINFKGKEYFDFYETLNKDQQEEIEKIIDGSGHKIGGYAFFTQYDPREGDEKLQNDILLLQIDSDDHIMFGDAGVANLFINPRDLKDKNFDKAWFTWDCC